jgi:hypothetical protein
LAADHNADQTGRSDLGIQDLIRCALGAPEAPFSLTDVEPSPHDTEKREQRMFAGPWLARRADLLFPGIRFADLRTNVAMAVDTAGMA